MSTKKTSFWLTPKGLAAMGLIGAATYFLLIEHRQHVWQYLPFLILLACPFMHIFMHGGHGGHSDHNNHGELGDAEEGKIDQDAYQQGLEEGRKQAEHQHH
tara:strand:+ start:1216 stop:1518 length:303 start_codon:yes stop_codon:yes gene_type:complete